MDDRPFHAVRALPNRGFGQSHENRLGKRARRDIDFDIHRDRLNAQQRERMQFGQHAIPHAGPRFPSASRVHCAPTPLPRKPPTRFARRR